MKEIDGVYKVEILGPYGWEEFSTAFMDAGQFRSASEKHFTSGTYQTKGDSFRMLGKMTQLNRHVTLFGEKGAVDLPIRFDGLITDDVVDGEAYAAREGNYKTRFRLHRISPIN